MNAVSEVSEHATACASDATPPGQRFTLRRTGRKPVRFAGWKMVEAVGGAETAPLHYDLSIYRTSAQHFVAELTARRGTLAAQDIARVESFESLDDLTQWLQTHRCAEDVPVPAALSCQEGPLALAALQAVRLRDTIARIEDEYQDLLSDVFEVLGVSDEPALRAKPADGHVG